MRCITIWAFCWSACYVYWYKRHILTEDLTVSGSDSDEESERHYSPEPGSSSPTKLPTPVHPQSQQRAPKYQLNLGTYTKHCLSHLWPSNAAFNSLLNSCNRFFIWVCFFHLQMKANTWREKSEYLSLWRKSKKYAKSTWISNQRWHVLIDGESEPRDETGIEKVRTSFYEFQMKKNWDWLIAPLNVWRIIL